MAHPIIDLICTLNLKGEVVWSIIQLPCSSHPQVICPIIELPCSLAFAHRNPHVACVEVPLVWRSNNMPNYSSITCWSICSDMWLMYSEIWWYYNKTTRVWWAVGGDHWVCGGGRSAPTTNKVISTYSTSDEGGFIFISYKREAYGRPKPQGMLYCTYYELNQCPSSVFSPTPFQFAHWCAFTS